MLQKMRSKQGFTLIELLIVVAIIGILAAIAIPQFNTYRQRGFNTAGVSDIKNLKTAEEALNTDAQTYGKTQVANNLTLATAATAGVLLTGPLGAATDSTTSNSAMVSGPRNVGGVVGPIGAGFTVSNGVNVVANAQAVGTDFRSASYMATAKHTAGTRQYITESESTAVLWVSSDAWAGNAMTVAGAPATMPAAFAAPTNGVDVNPGDAGGGTAPNANWVSM